MSRRSINEILKNGPLIYVGDKTVRDAGDETKRLCDALREARKVLNEAATAHSEIGLWAVQLRGQKLLKKWDTHD